MSIKNDDKCRLDDDLPPLGAEARAQRQATSLPMLWLLVGLVLIAGFVFMISNGNGLFHAKAGGLAPVRAIAASGA